MRMLCHCTGDFYKGPTYKKQSTTYNKNSNDILKVRAY